MIWPNHAANLLNVNDTKKKKTNVIFFAVFLTVIYIYLAQTA